jgi:hypothetical protein
MKTPLIVDAAWVERRIDRLLTPNGLMTVVFLILLSVFLLSGSGIEHRTMDRPDAGASGVRTSPLLKSH